MESGDKAQSERGLSGGTAGLKMKRHYDPGSEGTNEVGSDYCHRVVY